MVPGNPDVPESKGVKLHPVYMFGGKGNIEIIDDVKPVLMVITNKVEILLPLRLFFQMNASEDLGDWAYTCLQTLLPKWSEGERAFSMSDKARGLKGFKEEDGTSDFLILEGHVKRREVEVMETRRSIGNIFKFSTTKTSHEHRLEVLFGMVMPTLVDYIFEIRVAIPEALQSERLNSSTNKKIEEVHLKRIVIRVSVREIASIDNAQSTRDMVRDDLNHCMKLLSRLMNKGNHARVVRINVFPKVPFEVVSVGTMSINVFPKVPFEVVSVGPMSILDNKARMARGRKKKEVPKMLVMPGRMERTDLGNNMQMDDTVRKEQWNSGHHFYRRRLSAKGTSLSYITPVMKNGEKVIELKKKEIDKATEEWKQALILYVVGESPTIAAMKMYIALQVNTVRPHFLNNRPIIVKIWGLEFDFNKEVLQTIPIWVKYPNLPLCCWSMDSLSRISCGLGEPLYADECTTKVDRILFARVLIQMDVAKELPQKLKVEDPSGRVFEQAVQYE
ncbi:hypothetical protein H5410_015247 [Solanum commersonii]|uniref:DUF4283 domain-containing protein n=1 Tax=Solanum commersonii TaxID=4109 RepID=A0A9J5ZTW7_SOLCO|nr:hypothetical protein H5410_015247 [Solanum commersonii]